MMKKKKAIFLFLFFLFYALNAFAETSLKAQVDKISIASDDDVTYKLDISSSEKNIPQPKLPDFKGFNVISQAQSSSISLGQEGLKTTLTYVYLLSPQETGKFTIQPSQVKIKDQVYSSQSFEIEVKRGKTQPKATPEEKKPSLPQGPQPESEEEPQITL